ncbi:MAG: endolytic transglycosylase MltG [Candidatus Dadabacteria bacterium]|nr:endolytic transglycosylase MltG [Candidatus Dadabacteria bacterium]NIQ12864.1 endolytic transglycosylase MltG [Candidatus Dadabacteria bacterium]
MRPVNFLVTLLIIFSFLFLASLSFFFYFDKYSDQSKTVEIPRGMSLKTISGLLEERNLIRDKKLFFAFVLLNGTHEELKAGEYEFPQGSSINDIHNILIKGSALLRGITIPEGFTVNQIAELLEEKKILSQDKFYELANNKNYIKEKLGIEVDSLEGFLFPDTYSFNKNESAEIVINTMINKFYEVYNSIEKNNKLNLSLLEYVTYASIIEKETGVDSERVMVSAVIKNRLERGMKLECDPTVIYALGENYDGRLRRKHLQYISPYNTYVITGLPKGPIANPGKESLYAAFNPSDDDYLYFVSKGDGSHFFSNNYKTHVNAVNKFIRNKKN